jgi:hypothetical protein
VGTRFVLTRAFLDDNAVITDFKLADGIPAGWRLREALRRAGGGTVELAARLML